MKLKRAKTLSLMASALFFLTQCTSSTDDAPLTSQANKAVSGMPGGTTDPSERVMDFEEETDWSPIACTTGTSEHHVSGMSGLAVSGGGWMEVLSSPMSTLADVDETLAVSVKLPVSQPNPYWYGQIALLIDLPSQGIYHRWIGEQPLTGVATGEFVSLEFDIPADVLTALQQDYADLRIKLVLNVPHDATGEYVLDALRFEDLNVGPRILLGSETDRALKENRNSFVTSGDSMLLLGQVIDGGGIDQVTIQLNGGPETVVALDADGNFDSLIDLDVSATEFIDINTLVVTAVDNDGNTTSTTVTIESVGTRVPGEVVVLFTPESTPADRQSAIGSVGGTFGKSMMERLHLVNVAAGTELAAVQGLLENDFVRAAMPNFPMLPNGTVNDMYFNQQWNLTRIGATDAWDVSYGSEDIVVAVLDSGVVYDGGYMWQSHPCEVIDGGNYFDYDEPVMSNLWLNEKECCSTPPCESNCFPSKPQEDEDSCPIADLNSDGCPGECGVDDDGDGASDFNDPDVIQIFSNGRDDDGDGSVDEQGPGGTACALVTPGQLVSAAANEDCDGAANDDDENGYPDDCRGFQFGRQQGMLEDYFGYPVAPNDPSDLAGGRDGAISVIGHGTMTAQIIGELGDNCYGYSGVARRVKLMPLGTGRYRWNDGTRSLSPMPDFFSILEAYEYAAENGADITNASLSAPCNCLPVGDPSCVWECPWGNILTKTEVEDQMTLFMSEFASQNTLHVVAAGNAPAGGTGQDLDSAQATSFPQGVHLPNVIKVAASDYANDRADFSNYGATKVDIAAPGDNLPFHSGTSAAAPHVSGAAVLLMDAYPELKGDPVRLIQQLKTSVTTLPEWSGVVSSGGLLNVYNAITTSPQPATMFTDESDVKLTRGGRDLQTNDIDLIDVDGDGDLDILEMPCSPIGALSIPRLLLNEGGVFRDASATNWPQIPVSHCDADYGDIDGDGDIDIIAAGYYPLDDTSQGNQNQIYLNNNGVFTVGTSGRLPADLSFTRAAALCDLNSDGHLDIVTGNLTETLDPTHIVNRVLMNNGSGVFTEETSTRLLGVNRPEIGAPNKIVCAELSMALSSVCDITQESCRMCSDPGLSISEIAASGKVSDMTQCANIRSAISPDIVIANTQGTITRYFENQGSGIFQEATDKLNLPTILGARQEHDVEVADFNNDGSLDLMFVTVRGARNFMLLNNGAGTFTEATSQPIFNTGDWAREVEVADFDNDGDMDVIVLRGDPNEVKPGYHSYYRNDGGAMFTEVAVGIDTLYLITTDGDVGDIDNDGDMDLVIGNNGAMNQIMINGTI